LCTVAYDGDYDASPEAGPAALIRWPYNWIINWNLKYFYVFRHRQALRTAGLAALVRRLLSPMSGFGSTYRNSMPLCGVHCR